MKVRRRLTFEPYNDSAWALSFQAAAGIGYAVMEDLTLTLGYRLIGTMEANFSKYDTSKDEDGHDAQPHHRAGAALLVLNLRRHSRR